jgi:hypothetical protein
MFGFLFKKRLQPTIKQTIIVKKEVAKTRKQAEKLARLHADRIYTSRETSQSYRFRQRNPKDFDPKSFVTVKMEPGISIVLGKLKKGKT